MKTTKIYECQDCGALQLTLEKCWCCVDDRGIYSTRINTMK